MKFITIFSLTLLLICTQIIHAQQHLIKGKVKSALDQSPLPNVTIKSATGATTVSNMQGEFTLALKETKNTITLSLMGYQTLSKTIGLSLANEVIILLEPSTNTLNEVTISTGYEKLPKERATGSFTLIDNKKYNEQIGTGVLERLRYITNGVAAVPDRITNFGENAMLIRGMSTFTLGVQRPLIIVDHFEYQGDLNNINPNDIENISFLKDAAAGSIWGAKAANGVIVITTKKGKFGQALKISFTANISTAAPPDLGYDRPIASSDLIEVERYLFAQKYRFTDTARSTNPPFSQAYELLFKHKNGKLSTAALETALAELAKKDVRDDFSKYFYQAELNQQYALSMSGGSPTMSWSLGLGMDRNSSNLAASYRRHTIRFNNQIQLHKQLALNLDAAFTNSEAGSGKPAYGSIVLSVGALPMYSSFADEQGNALPIYNNYRQDYIDNIGGGKLLDWRYYPLEDYKHSQTLNKINDLNASVGLNYTILPELKADVKYRITRQWSDIATLNTEQSYFTRGQINHYTQVNATTGNVTYKSPRGSIYDTGNEVMTAQNLRAQLNLNKNFNIGQWSVLAGTEWSEKQALSQNQRLYGYDPETLSFTPVDLVNTYPTYMSGSLGLIPDVTGRGATNNRFISYYGNTSFTIQQRYTISASARRDASNLFGVATNDRFNPFWSMGASWNVDREKWFKVDWLPYLKLRGSYGLQGNIDPKKVAVTTISYGNNSVFTQTPAGQVVNYPNPDLRWEKVAMINVGADFRALQGKLAGSVEYYQKRMSDLYALVAVDRTTGISSGAVTRNIGKSVGHGWDIELKTQQKIGFLNWNADVIFNTYTDKVTKLDDKSFTGREVMGAGFVIVEGYAASSIFAFKWAGLDSKTGDPMGYLNGVLSKDYASIVNQTLLKDAEFIGTQFPKIFGSLGSNWSYKGFELSARLTYKFDYFFKRNSIQYSSLVSQLAGHADYAKRWQKPGDEAFTSVPSFVYPSNSSRDEFYRNASILYEKGGHIRLQYVNLSYSLTKTTSKWLPVQGLRLGIAANNLGIIWKANKAGLDPEAGLFPRSENVSFNLNVNF